jgi:hypothetical protein
MVVLCALCAAPGQVRAQTSEAANGPPAAQVLDQARQLFNQGLEYVEREDWAQAEDRFRRVLALRSSHVVSYNLASALMHLGRLVESSELLRAIVRDTTADVTTRDAATQLLSELEPRIGSLTIRVSGDARGAILHLDDKPIELSGSVQALSVDPGEHHVSLERDGAVLSTKSVEVGNQAPLQAELLLEVAPRVAPQAAASALPLSPNRPRAAFASSTSIPAPEPARSDSLVSKWWFWTSIGAVVAGGVVAGVLLANSGSQAQPVMGDTNPPVIRGQVQMGMP